jgi:hypothetical protein
MNPLSEHRARALADLPALGVKLPVTVAKAISGFEHAMAMRAKEPPQPGQAVRLAIADYATDLADGALMQGRAPSTPDPRRIARAREREQAAIDTADVTREIRTAAVITLSQICDQQQSVILAALRARYREQVTALIGHARQIPPGTSDRAALEAGGAIRDAYLAAEEVVVTIERLRAVLHSVAPEPSQGPVPGLLERGLSFVKTTAVSDQMTRDGMTPWGALGSFSFYVGAAQEITDPGDWWLPTIAEVTARADEITKERRIEGLKATAGG